MIIPERMVLVLAEATLGRVSKIPQLLKLVIIRYCHNSPETFNITFPFISADDGDLELDSPIPYYMHIIDLPVL